VLTTSSNAIGRPAAHLGPADKRLARRALVSSSEN
jgi:hypothetical protein